MSQKRILLIDPGHPALDNGGAVADGVREADINLSVAMLLGGIMVNEGWEVHFTRYSNILVELAYRVRSEHILRPDLFLSLHCNSVSSPGPHGLEVFTSPGQTAADPAATAICNALAAAFPDSRFRGDLSDGDPDKEANYYVLVNTRAPAVLVEMGFLSNAIERAWLTQRHTQIQIAMALAAGVLGWAAHTKE
ncbi:MAG: N-acetylmuramoyl-L-alanine amidase [Desulfuromonas sp.]|nr:MAG: N-acetylmuramoyl-L-alanine amidase [Desulfuromonas sp.]